MLLAMLIFGVILIVLIWHIARGKT
jgi:hypothetical protein